MRIGSDAAVAGDVDVVHRHALRNADDAADKAVGNAAGISCTPTCDMHIQGSVHGHIHIGEAGAVAVACNAAERQCTHGRRLCIWLPTKYRPRISRSLLAVDGRAVGDIERAIVDRAIDHCAEQTAGIRPLVFIVCKVTELLLVVTEVEVGKSCTDRRDAKCAGEHCIVSLLSVGKQCQRRTHPEARVDLVVGHFARCTGVRCFIRHGGIEHHIRSAAVKRRTEDLGNTAGFGVDHHRCRIFVIRGYVYGIAFTGESIETRRRCLSAELIGDLLLSVFVIRLERSLALQRCGEIALNFVTSPIFELCLAGDAVIAEFGGQIVVIRHRTIVGVEVVSSITHLDDIGGREFRPGAAVARRERRLRLRQRKRYADAQQCDEQDSDHCDADAFCCFFHISLHRLKARISLSPRRGLFCAAAVIDVR